MESGTLNLEMNGAIGHHQVAEVFFGIEATEEQQSLTFHRSPGIHPTLARNRAYSGSLIRCRLAWTTDTAAKADPISSAWFCDVRLRSSVEPNRQMAALRPRRNSNRDMFINKPRDFAVESPDVASSLICAMGDYGTQDGLKVSLDSK